MPAAKPARSTKKMATTASRARRLRPASSTTGSALPLEAMRLPLEGLRGGRTRTKVVAVHDPFRLVAACLVEDADRGIRPRRERRGEDRDAHGGAETADRGLEREPERGHGDGTHVVGVDASLLRHRLHLILEHLRRLRG